MIKKVLFHINSLGKGGAERVVSVLADEMSAQGIEVLLATEWKAKDEYSVSEKVHRFHVGLKEEEESLSGAKKRSIREKRLRGLFIKEKPEVVFSFCRNANYRAILASRGTGVPVIYSVRSDPSVDYASQKQKILSSVLYKKAAGGVFQTTDARDYFPEEIRANSKIILNPVDKKYEKTLSPKERRKAIVAVGRFHDAKDHMTLIRGFERVMEKFPEYNLELYGDRSEDNTVFQVKEHVKAHKLGDRVLFMGNHDDLENCIADAALFVLSSKYEGMPNALMEAMVMGLPCIATDCPCGGPRTLIEDGENGLLTDVGDDELMGIAIDKMLSYPEEADRIGKNARRLAERVAPAAIAGEWLSSSDECIAGK